MPTQAQHPGKPAVAIRVSIAPEEYLADVVGALTRRTLTMALRLHRVSSRSRHLFPSPASGIMKRVLAYARTAPRIHQGLLVRVWPQRVTSFVVALLASCFATSCLPHDASVQYVAEPTGDGDRDRASLQAAFDSVEAGGTVQFAAGVYLVGGRGLILRRSDVILRGHAGGTILRGCSDEQLGSMDEDAYFASCNGIALVGGRQEVRSLTFEGFAGALSIEGESDSIGQRRLPNADGGHVIEGNTFRRTTTVEVHVHADSAVTIRGNTFRNTYHAVAILGRNVHVLQNDIAAPEPTQVPFGWPSLAIGIRPQPDIPCTGNRIEGNIIDGHTDAVIIAVLPLDGPGAACERNTVRENTVRVRALTYPAFLPPRLAGQPLSGVPIRLLNLQLAMATGTPTFPLPPNFPPPPPEFAQAAVRDNLIEGNRITGAFGVAIELIHAGDNRVMDNVVEATIRLTTAEIARRAALPPFGIGPGFWLMQSDAAAANGSDIYTSPAIRK